MEAGIPQTTTADTADLDLGIGIDEKAPAVAAAATTAAVEASTLLTAANIQPFTAGKPNIKTNYASFTSSTPAAATSADQHDAYRRAITEELSQTIDAWRNNPDQKPLELPSLSPDNRGDLSPADHYGIYLAATQSAMQAANLTPQQAAQVRVTPSSDAETAVLATAMTNFEAFADSAQAQKELHAVAYNNTVQINPDRVAEFKELQKLFLEGVSPDLLPIAADGLNEHLKNVPSKASDSSVDALRALLSEALKNNPQDPKSATKPIFESFAYIGEENPAAKNKEQEAGHLINALDILANNSPNLKDAANKQKEAFSNKLSASMTNLLESATASPNTADKNAAPVKIAVDPQTKANAEKVKATLGLIGVVAATAASACFFPPVAVLFVLAAATYFMNKGKAKADKEAAEAEKEAAEKAAALENDPDLNLTAEEYLAKLNAEREAKAAAKAAALEEATAKNDVDGVDVDGVDADGVDADDADGEKDLDDGYIDVYAEGDSLEGLNAKNLDEAQAELVEVQENLATAQDNLTAAAAQQFNPAIEVTGIEGKPTDIALPTNPVETAALEDQAPDLPSTSSAIAQGKLSKPDESQASEGVTPAYEAGDLNSEDLGDSNETDAKPAVKQDSWRAKIAEEAERSKNLNQQH